MCRSLTISVLLFGLATVIWATETTKAPPRAITKEPFGEIKGANGVQTVTLYTLSNKNKFTVKIMDYGATITSITTPDRKGEVKRILLGYDDLACKYDIKLTQITRNSGYVYIGWCHRVD